MISLLILIISSAYIFHWVYWRRRNLPPGPIPVPFIGNLYLMNEESKPGYKLWKILREKYGPVYTFWLAHMPMVVLTDWNLIKKYFIKDASNFIGRPEFPISLEIRGGAYGIIEAYGERWQSQRRFTLHVFRNFGLGRNLMEDKVIDETHSFLDKLRRDANNGALDLRTYFDSAVGSIINSLLFGYRYDESNMDEFLLLKSRLENHFKLAAEPMGGLIGMYPWLGKLPYFREKKQIVVSNWSGLLELFRKQANDRMRTIDYDSEEYSDFVEAFLKERKKHENEPDYGGFELSQFDSVCFDLWVAGMETTANTLYWSVLYVLLHPDVKDKVYRELNDVIGSDRTVRSADRPLLKYINATINESQRMANLLPMNVSHATTTDVNIEGFEIPRNTLIIPQISQVLYDETIFPEPHTFKPERFLDEEGNLKKVEEFVPFSIGKRQCLGEGLARLELFIFFTNLFNQYDISLDSSNPNPSTEKDYGITMKAQSYKINLKPRIY